MNNNGNRRPDFQRRQENGGRQNLRKRPQNGGIQISYNTIGLIVCAVLVLINLKIFSSVITNNEKVVSKIDAVQQAENNENAVQAPKDGETLLKEDIETNFTTITASTTDIKKGNLILINGTHPYDFETLPKSFVAEEGVPIPDSTDASYWVKSNRELLTPSALSAIDRLLTDFAKETGNTDVMILDTNRSFEEQDRILKDKIYLLGEEQGRKIAAQPGHSEHHSCLALDLTLFNGSVYDEYDGTGVYQWITDNCYKYGYIVRYTENKEDVTGIISEPWHLRYVGKAHAYYMKASGLCLEEYIELLASYPLESSRLNFVTDEGESYTVYSCKVDADGDTIHVPKNGTYTLSGDNDGRVIVTCKNP